uniref:Glycoside hydrolase family 2 catalytic domain-containing protein n=1 Tax=Panagrolaimus sp. JU765 TaxID=591449 RepID=A0AC34QZ72_9BILA
MNILRVWGGGTYESDICYEWADEKGILIWQDMMFACALYPVDEDFLNNVKKEINHQIRRLRHHPSVLVWTGNNENHVAIKSNWWQSANYSTETMIDDYLKLYKETIGSIVKELDPSRPYLLSSPSNGAVTEQYGGMDDNPNSEFYGDVHFYSETKNLWKDFSYMIPRCATEYGVQSLPLK